MKIETPYAKTSSIPSQESCKHLKRVKILSGASQHSSHPNHGLPEFKPHRSFTVTSCTNLIEIKIHHNSNHPQYWLEGCNSKLGLGFWAVQSSPPTPYPPPKTRFSPFVWFLPGSGGLLVPLSSLSSY